MAQDAFTNISPIITFASVIAALFLSRRFRGRTRVLIPDYRRGVRFVGGVFSDVLDAGSYSFDGRKEQVTIVDMRPQPILIERLPFQDALNHQGVISVGAELVVSDPQLAASALRDQVKDAYILARNSIRAAISQQIVTGTGDLNGVTAPITSAVRSELRRVGMDIANVDVTELWLSPSVPQPHMTAGTAVVQ
jgi:hypothetical protein